MDKKIKELDKETLIRLLESYDSYIQYANDDNLYSTGWLPVCIDEYYKNDFLEEESVCSNCGEELNDMEIKANEGADYNLCFPCMKGNREDR